MKWSEARQGRAFVLRLEDGEVLHEQIEAFASERSIRAAAVVAVGAAGPGTRLVVGPEDAEARPIRPMQQVLPDVHEIAGTGTLFPDEHGRPVLHMHVACGRGASTVTGCARGGLRVWQTLEVVLIELADATAARALDPSLGFQVLEP